MSIEFVEREGQCYFVLSGYTALKYFNLCRQELRYVLRLRTVQLIRKERRLGRPTTRAMERIVAEWRCRL